MESRTSIASSAMVGFVWAFVGVLLVLDEGFLAGEISPLLDLSRKVGMLVVQDSRHPESTWIANLSSCQV